MIKICLPVQTIGQWKALAVPKEEKKEEEKKTRMLNLLALQSEILKMVRGNCFSADWILVSRISFSGHHTK